jgi:catechol 2,3-dioxygenase-like lactoylglutathione lyase family enzyme
MPHVYIAVSDLARAQEFYDRVFQVLGFRRSESTIAGDPHLHYGNRQFGYSLRPARAGAAPHDPYAPGLHHFCFRVVNEQAVDRAARELELAGIEASAPQYYPEYAPDYYATFFSDPDGLRLEITNFREFRRVRMYDADTSG